jgi:hypothetical protein
MEWKKDTRHEMNKRVLQSINQVLKQKKVSFYVLFFSYESKWNKHSINKERGLELPSR